MENDFYKDKYFEAIMKQIADMQQDISVIKSRIGYIYGFAAAIGFVTSFALNWLQAKVNLHG